MRPWFLLFSIALAAAMLAPADAWAQVPTVPAGATQSIVKTTRDQVLVWRRHPSAVIATLPEGVTLEAIAPACHRRGRRASPSTSFHYDARRETFSRRTMTQGGAGLTPAVPVQRNK